MIDEISDLTFNEFEPLKKHCTFGIGGPARYFCQVRSTLEMQKTIKYCSQHKIPFMVLGKGSNCLFDDRGYHGAVILNKIDFCKENSPGSYYVGAGYSFALLGVQTARKGYSGLEFASGIPASVGGAVWMNAGANGKETADCLQSVDFINLDGELITLHKKDLSFTYRKSPFQKMKGAIVGASFLLKEDLEARKKQIDIVTYRKNTQPYGEKSAGCVFLNPECGHAGALIDQCGLKGAKVGHAEVSKMHGNFLINSKDATCQDILALIEHVTSRVKENTGIELKTEIHHIPYDA